MNSGSGTYDNIRFSGRSNQQNIIRYDGVEGELDHRCFAGQSQWRNDLQLPTAAKSRKCAGIPGRSAATIRPNTAPEPAARSASSPSRARTICTDQFSNTSATTGLDARNFFSGSQNDKLRLNQFGGSLGGAIIKDKLFCFRQLRRLAPADVDSICRDHAKPVRQFAGGSKHPAPFDRLSRSRSRAHERSAARSV